MDYPEFLAARLDEQEAEAGEILKRPNHLRVLTLAKTTRADIKAKRAILNRHTELAKLERHYRDTVPSYSYTFFVQLQEAELVIEHLSLPFADHPDYPHE